MITLTLEDILWRIEAELNRNSSWKFLFYRAYLHETGDFVYITKGHGPGPEMDKVDSYYDHGRCQGFPSRIPENSAVDAATLEELRIQLMDAFYPDEPITVKFWCAHGQVNKFLVIEFSVWNKIRDLVRVTTDWRLKSN